MRATLAVPMVSLLVTACSGAHAVTTTTHACEPRPIAWSIPGLALEERCRSQAVRERCEAIGVAPSGTVIQREALFVRAGARSADELAQIAQDTVLGDLGAEPILPGADPSRSALLTPEALAVVHAPEIRDGVLSFFSLASDGFASESFDEIQVDLATGHVERVPALELYARAATPSAVECGVRAECGCERGCVRVGRIEMPAGRSAVFRVLDGDDTGLLLTRDDPLGTLSPLASPACEEACAPRPASHACALEHDLCVDTAVAPVTSAPPSRSPSARPPRATRELITATRACARRGELFTEAFGTCACEAACRVGVAFDDLPAGVVSIRFPFVDVDGLALELDGAQRVETCAYTAVGHPVDVHLVCAR